MSDLLSAADTSGMNQWVSRTATVLATFPTWSAGVRCLDLTEELGELARAILIAEGRKSATEREEPIAQALCGVLFDVFALAQHYGVDLDAEYGEQVAQLAARRASS